MVERMGRGRSALLPQPHFKLGLGFLVIRPAHMTQLQSSFNNKGGGDGGGHGEGVAGALGTAGRNTQPSKSCDKVEGALSPQSLVTKWKEHPALKVL